MSLFDSILWDAFNPVSFVKSLMFFSGGGGGGNQTSTGTTYSTNLPEYAAPYYQELLKQTGKNIFNTDASGTVTGVKDASGLPQQTVAGFNPLQTTTQANVAGLKTPGQFGTATSGLNAGTALGYGTAGAGIGQALSYNPASAGTFDASAASRYMSPYASAVTDQAVREAALKGAQDKSALMSGAIGRGTFGGARNALLQAEQTRGLNQNLADIRNRGAQEAYTNAQTQFNADQTRQQQAQQYAAGLGAQLGQAGLSAGLQGSTALGALGTAQQAADLSRLQAQNAVGTEQQTLAQKQADTDYQNQMAAQNYQKQQLQFYSDILRGNAGALGSTAVNYAPAPSAISQIGGLGLGALGLSKALS
jgi:hypothetical protein